MRHHAGLREKVQRADQSAQLRKHRYGALPSPPSGNTEGFGRPGRSSTVGSSFGTDSMSETNSGCTAGGNGRACALGALSATVGAIAAAGVTTGA